MGSPARKKDEGLTTLRWAAHLPQSRRQSNLLSSGRIYASGTEGNRYAEAKRSSTSVLTSATVTSPL